MDKPKVLFTSELDESSVDHFPDYLEIDVIPFIRIRKEFDPDELFRIATSYYPQLVILSSKNAINCYEVLCDIIGDEHDLVVLSEALADAITFRETDIRIAKEPRQESLIQYVSENFSDKRSLHLCGNLNKTELSQALSDMGLKSGYFQAYETQLNYRQIDASSYDFVIFKSYSAIDSFFRKNNLDKPQKAIVIGPKTGDYLRKFWKGEMAVAEKPDNESIIKELEKYYAQDYHKN